MHVRTRDNISRTYYKCMHQPVVAVNGVSAKVRSTSFVSPQVIHMCKALIVLR